ncbi:probable carboxylesterase 120 [Olea europaea subsp. europaea]|uniref:Probable carboxylesterase 120 n=1 Tax=Olea europaea subsp. europaea TaxID=158383 RepID=A0A8S0RWM3_OLEEU|nr:probable carboxylesterase 120 [Olea europaea subsp. europaea]
MASPGKKIERPVIDNPLLNIKVNPDGSLKRDPEPRNPANPDPNVAGAVLSKDLPLDANKKTWLRLYIPRQVKIHPSSSSKLPVIIYYHGGGFVFYNADSAFIDVFCKGLVEKVGVMVISLDYRLAPEHRLPAAYEDAMDGLYWIKTVKDKWLSQYADLNNCFLCGTSAGGNLAYHAGLMAAAAGMELRPMNINGLILHHPYFSGTKRTGSEERLKNDPFLPLYSIDQMFDLSLPEGADHDHEYCNPLVNGGSKNIDLMKSMGWRVLVTGCFDDPLMDAGLECANMLEGKGMQTVKFFTDGYHAMEVYDASMSGPLYDAIKDFIHCRSNE